MITSSLFSFLSIQFEFYSFFCYHCQHYMLIYAFFSRLTSLFALFSTAKKKNFISKMKIKWNKKINKSNWQPIKRLYIIFSFFNFIIVVLSGSARLMVFRTFDFTTTPKKYQKKKSFLYLSRYRLLKFIFFIFKVLILFFSFFFKMENDCWAIHDMKLKLLYARRIISRFFLYFFVTYFRLCII